MSNFIAQSLFGIPLVIVITLTLYAAMRALRSPLRRHAREKHGMQTVPPEVAQQIKSKIRDE
jgi:Protein of unknown function (DUF1059)